MALQAVLHFKDNTVSAPINGGANASIDGDLFRVLDAGTPTGSTLAIAPLTNVEYVEFSA